MGIYKRILPYTNGVKLQGLLAIICSLASSLFVCAGYFYVYKALESIIFSKSLGFSVAIYSCVFLTIGGLLYCLAMYFSHIFGFRVENNLRKAGAMSIMNASSSFFDTHESGVIRKSIDDNAAMTHSAVADLLPDLGIAMLTPLLMIAFSFFISLKVFLVVMVFVIISCFLVKKMMGGDSSFMQTYEDSLKDMSAKSVEYIRGISVIKLFDMPLPKALKDSISNYAKNTYAYTKTCQTPYLSFQWMFLGVAPFIVMAFFSEQKEVLLELVMIFFILGVVFVSIMRIMHLAEYFFKANYAINTLENLSDEMSQNRPTFGTLEEFKNYDIEFKNISFSYDKTPIFKDFSLKLKSGKTYAIVGLSGSGKSTLVKLLNGSYKLSGGEILIGEKPINEYSQKAINDTISFVYQNTKLFKTSIYENIAFAKDGAKYDEVMNALNLANCMEFIDELKDKEQSSVELSGGQRQRLSVARAILKDFKILVLDEASSSLDIQSEYEILKSIKTISKNKTTIMIAHRLSSLKNVDEIIVLKDARIAERGGFDELIAKNGEFFKMYELFVQTNKWRI